MGLFRKNHIHPTISKDERAEQERVAEAERRAAVLRARAEKVAASLERRLRENGFAEGLGAAWGNGRHRA